MEKQIAKHTDDRQADTIDANPVERSYEDRLNTLKFQLTRAETRIEVLEAALRKLREALWDEVDELVCEWGSPEWVQTDDGEAWYWRFSGHELPVADNLSELFKAAQDLSRRKK